MQESNIIVRYALDPYDLIESIDVCNSLTIDRARFCDGAMFGMFYIIDQKNSANNLSFKARMVMLYAQLNQIFKEMESGVISKGAASDQYQNYSLGLSLVDSFLEMQEGNKEKVKYRFKKIKSAFERNRLELLNDITKYYPLALKSKKCQPLFDCLE